MFIIIISIIIVSARLKKWTSKRIRFRRLSQEEEEEEEEERKMLRFKRSL